MGLGIGDFLGPVATLAGGLLGHESEEDERHLREQLFNQNAALQREFAQMGIQWRVQDAVNAGLHPMYALGGSGASFAPGGWQTIAGNPLGKAISQMGQDVSRSMMAQQSEEERQLRMELLRAQIYETEARGDEHVMRAFGDSTAARARQGDSTSAPIVNAYGVETAPVDVAGRTRVESHPFFQDTVKVNPAERISRDSRYPGITGSRENPGYSEYVSPDGSFRYLLPATKDGQPPEDLDAVRIPDILGANLERYGMRFIPNYLRYITGQSYTRSYNVERGLRQLGDWMQRKGLLNMRSPNRDIRED